MSWVPYWTLAAWLINWRVRTLWTPQSVKLVFSKIFEWCKLSRRRLNFAALRWTGKYRGGAFLSSAHTPTVRPSWISWESGGVEAAAAPRTTANFFFTKDLRKKNPKKLQLTSHSPRRLLIRLYSKRSRRKTNPQLQSGAPPPQPLSCLDSSVSLSLSASWVHVCMCVCVTATEETLCSFRPSSLRSSAPFSFTFWCGRVEADRRSLMFGRFLCIVAFLCVPWGSV